MVLIKLINCVDFKAFEVPFMKCEIFLLLGDSQMKRGARLAMQGGGQLE